MASIISRLADLASQSANLLSIGASGGSGGGISSSNGRPVSSANGNIIWNSANNTLEVWKGTSWTTIA
jgi:hypothetical protein